MTVFREIGERNVQSEGKEFLKALARCADPADLPALIAACAGRRVYLTETPPSPRHWMSRAIGHDKAVALFACLERQLEYFKGDVEVPFAGSGLMSAVRQIVSSRIMDGLRKGKPTETIAAECGITPRQVRRRVAGLRSKGLLPEIPPVARALSKYFHSLSQTERSLFLVDNFGNTSDGQPPAAATTRSNLNLNAILGSLAPGVAANPSDVSREMQVLAEIEARHGHAIREKVEAACAGKSVSLAPAALERASHPFRAGLDEVEAKCVAIRLLLSGASMKALRFGVGIRRTDAEGAALRDQAKARLLQGERPNEVAHALGLKTTTVRRIRQRLLVEGLIARSRVGRPRSAAGRAHG